MNREEALEIINKTKISFGRKNGKTAFIEALDRLQKPMTLAEFLGWEEGVKYIRNGDVFKIEGDHVMGLKNGSYWINPYFKSCELVDLRQAENIEPKYYAKIKGWELLGSDICYFYQSSDKYIYLTSEKYAGRLTKEEWAELGITDENADFEEVE